MSIAGENSLGWSSAGNKRMNELSRSFGSSATVRTLDAFLLFPTRCSKTASAQPQEKASSAFYNLDKKMSSWWLGFPPHTKGGLHPWKSCSMCLRIIIFLLHNVHAAASEAVASEAYGLFSQQKRRRCIYIYIVVNWTHAASSLVRGQWRHSSRTRTGTRPLQPLKPRD